MKKKCDFINESIITSAVRLDATAESTEAEELYEQLPPQIKQRYSYTDMVRCAKKLPPHVGVFKAGRRGHPSRIEWTSPVGTFRGLEVPARGANGLESNEAFQSQPGPNTPASPTVVLESEETLEHPFALRPGHRISLKLPADLTQTEAERLATFVRSLPFNPNANPAS